MASPSEVILMILIAVSQEYPKTAGVAAMERGRFDQLLVSEAKLANRSFRVKFQGSAHEELRKQMVELRRDVDRVLHYSVYAAVVQASGMGKTRAVLETSRLVVKPGGPEESVYVCYCTLAGPQSTAFPPRTGLLADKLASTHSEEGMVLYIKAWLLVLARALDRNPRLSAAEWVDLQLPPIDASLTGPWSSDLAAEVRRVWDILMQEVTAEMEEVDDAIDPDKRNESLLVNEIAAVEKHVQGLARVVFVFDEARGLQQVPENLSIHDSAFCQARRALRVFFAHPLFFALMLDTDAKLSNFFPSLSREPSARALVPGTSLLRPIYYIPNLGLSKPLPGASLSHYVKAASWLRYGRPLWAARLDQEADLDRLVGFAQQKLVGTMKGEFMGFPVDFANGKMAQSQAIALLTAAVGLDICPTSTLAELMAASHMSLVLRFSKDRSRIFVGLPVEPILAEAAARTMQRDIVKTEVLSHMEKACMQGFVTPGPTGEFVAKFILVAAMWSLKADNSWYLHKVTLDDYLEKLLVTDQLTFSNLKRKRNWDSCPAEAYVFFNSFVVVSRPPDAAMLGRCFAAGQAMMYQADNNLPGADLIIPVWTPKGMTCIAISVKNILRPGWLEKVSTDKLKGEFTQIRVADELPVITIAMSLREPSVTIGAEWNWILWKEVEEGQADRHIHVTSYGIKNNYRFLSKAVKDKLQYILHTRPDPLAGADDAEEEWVKTMLQERYEEPDPRFNHICF